MCVLKSLLYFSVLLFSVVPVVTFSQEVYAVSEGDTTLTVTLNMDSAASGDVMVEVTSVDETAKGKYLCTVESLPST